MNEQTAHSVEAASAASTEVAPLLVARDLHKSYGAVRAVVDVTFKCRPGEVHALVGENGAGKSTVSKILSGAVAATSGEVLVDGEPLRGGSIARSRALGIACAYQEIALVPEWTVAENLALPDLPAVRPFAPRKAVQGAKALLARLGLTHIDPQARVGTLLLADRQLVEIARAIAAEPKLLILDEASSALTPPGVEWLFDRIREITARGGAVIYVSHRLREIREIADRGTVLRDGAAVGTFEKGGWTDDELISLMAGRAASKQFPDVPVLAGDAPEVLSVSGLRSARLTDVSLTVRAGEILGIGGLQGHGQTELLRALFGATPATAGEWRIGGRDVRSLTPLRAVKAGVGYVPEDRKREGLALDLGVGENLEAPWTRAFGLGGRALLSRDRDWIRTVLTSLSVRTRGPLEAAGNLSGGNQQKLVFGRWLDRDRRLLILHDPTRGIDVRAKQELYRAMVALARQGVGIVWFSTEVEELVHMCHRIAVLYRGTVTQELSGSEITADAVVGAAVGMRSAE
ncbi:sugar ABC transporter ATP-binding protein [Microbacterium aquilitoris]|uniref:sugar ABC transporter ATP-binding protein n=1 Tax=Microbacterium aquilitoris TaxID=3067307 RepID=UPI00288F78C0|nr:sugar ABC transporter ATP-binding protein [Microbacterium sp. KSW2-22]MDT3345016.1 sugar ABC transporter ATP-binding protein [Microbacterium sp. KSW2-22]